jgi:hypothetical protein
LLGFDGVELGDRGPMDRHGLGCGQL